MNTTVTDQELADYIAYWKLDDLANPQHRHGLHMGQRMALALRAARQEAAEVEKLRAERDAITKGYPSVCPFTGLKFFMELQLPDDEGGAIVPTYGGPFDSYTIPERDSDGHYFQYRYDHDEGGWLEQQGLSLVVVSDIVPYELVEVKAERDRLSEIVGTLIVTARPLAAAMGAINTLNYLDGLEKGAALAKGGK